MIEVSRDWTRYGHRGDRWSRERCLRCGAPIADGREVLVGADGLVHKECWWVARAESLSRRTRRVVGSKRPRPRYEAAHVLGAAIAAAILAAVVLAQVLR